MKIWLIVLGEPLEVDGGSPRLLRTGILAGELRRRGHDVTFWSSSVDHVRKTQRCDKTSTIKIDNNFRYILLYGRLYRSNVSFRRVAHNFDTAREFDKIAPLQPAPDAIVCSFPTIELAHAAARFARMHNIPLIVDVRDFWPDIISNSLSPLKKAASFPLFHLWNKQIEAINHNASYVTGITKAAIEWFRGKSQINTACDEIAFPLAYPRHKSAPGKSQFLRSLNLTPGKDNILCFFGSLSARHEFGVLAEACHMLKQQGLNDVKMVLCGSGPRLEKLRAKGQGLGNLFLPGWVGQDEIRELMSFSMAGLLPYPSTFDFVRSYPNKVGEYLSAGLPIISSLRGETEKILQKHACGITYKNEDAAGLVEAIKKIRNSSDLQHRMRSNAADLFDKKFDAGKVYPSYCNLIEEIASRPAKNG